MQDDEVDPQRDLQRQFGGDVGTMAENIKIEREYDRIFNRLKAEFQSIDRNNDNTITFQELLHFLNVKTKGTADTRMAEEIF